MMPVTRCLRKYLMWRADNLPISGTPSFGRSDDVFRHDLVVHAIDLQVVQLHNVLANDLP